MDTDNFSTAETMFRGDLPQEDTRIKIIGVGGAGNNAVDRIKMDHGDRVRLAAINTDAQALATSPLEEKVMIGRSVTRGLSTGGEPDLARKGALSDRDKIAVVTGGMDLVFLVAGLGGGTGSGAMPVIAEIAAEQGALVIAFVTLPFTMEGSRRQEQAQESLIELRRYCDAVIPLPNDLLLQQMDDDSTVLDAFSQVDAWISRGVYSICSILFNTGLINIDFTTLRQAFVSKGGKTLFGLGRAEGDDCVNRAVQDLLMCPLLHLPESALCADHLLVNIIGGTDLSLSKVNEMMAVVADKFKSQGHTVLGAVIDERLQNSVEICVIGTTDISHHKKVVEAEETIALPRPEPVRDVISEDIADEVMPASAEAPVVHESKLAAKEQEEDKSLASDQEEFSFILEKEQRGYFDNTERNLFEGQDLDVPTYLRLGIKVNL